VAPGARAQVDQAGELRLARLESLRALAALGVLAGHVWGAHHAFGPSATDDLVGRTIFGGGYGVFVFFALSGYLCSGRWPTPRSVASAWICAAMR